MITGANLKTNLRRKVMIKGAHELSKDTLSVKLMAHKCDDMEAGLPVVVRAAASVEITDRVVFVEPHPALSQIGVVQGQRIYAEDDGKQFYEFSIYNYNSLEDVEKVLAELPYFCKLFVQDRI